MKIEPLKNYPKLYKQINEICFKEFHYFFPNLSISDFEKSLKAKLNTDKLPIFYIAFEKNKLIGFFVLRKHDEKIAKDFSPPLKQNYSPWFGTLVILSKYRGLGYGKQLVQIAKEKIQKFGYKELYIFTDKENFYQKLDFKIIQKTYLNNNPVSIMHWIL
jgi:N-acetylglutamate synthase-like GNAT family acetyltransferase